MPIQTYYTDTPVYHEMHLSAHGLAKLLPLATDNKHIFIDRQAVVALLYDPDLTLPELEQLSRWLAACPDADELYFSFDI